MGHYIFSYGIKTEELKSKFGSKDQEALSKIQSTNTFENYKDFQPSPYQTSPKKAIEDIINGETYDKSSGFAYGYALICMSAGLGNKLPYSQEIKMGYETDTIEQVMNEDFDNPHFEFQELLFANFNPFSTPKPDDFPLTGIVYNADLVEIKEQYQHITISDDTIAELEDTDFEKGMALRHIKGILKNIDYCLEHQLDLISFCH